MKLLKRYGLLAVYLLFQGIAFFYLMPSQKRSYIPGEIERFSTTITQALLLIDAGVLCALLVVFIVKKFSIRQAVGSVFTALLIMLGLFFAFKDSLPATGLYINQWKVRQRFEQAYVAQYLNNDRSSETNFSLYDLKARKIIMNGDLVKTAYRSGPAPGDTIYAYLNRGLLNVVYFGDTAVRKR